MTEIPNCNIQLSLCLSELLGQLKCQSPMRCVASKGSAPVSFQ